MAQNSDAEPEPGSQTFDAVAARVTELVAYFEAHPYVAVRDAALELLQGVDALHRAGVVRLVALLVEARGEGVLAELAEDPLAGPVLDLYDLLPADLKDERSQVEDALDTVRPYIHSHSGEVEVLDVVDGVVHVRLAGACHGCSGSTITLHRGVEEALRTGYPGFVGLEVHEPVKPAGFVGLDQLKASAGLLRRPEWTIIARVEEVPLGAVRGFDGEGFSVLLCNVGGEIYGFHDSCTECSMPLREGKLSGPVLVCPWQNCAYDARTGKRVDDQSGRLQVYPIAINNGEVKLALNVPGAAPGYPLAGVGK